MPVHGCSMAKLVVFGYSGRTAPIREVTFDFVAKPVGTNLTLRCVTPEVHRHVAPSWYHDSVTRLVDESRKMELSPPGSARENPSLCQLRQTPGKPSVVKLGTNLAPKLGV